MREFPDHAHTHRLARGLSARSEALPIAMFTVIETAVAEPVRPTVGPSTICKACNLQL
jgi:hypothetical protein